MKSTNVFNDISSGVQLWSKWDYVTNMCSQQVNSSILKNLYQVKYEKTHEQEDNDYYLGSTLVVCS
jgi:hypothetical protein